MLIVERHNRLVDILRQRGSAQLDELASALSVSASTVRRDLEALEKRGLVERTHGGAVFRAERPASADSIGQTLSTRINEHISAKEAIGRHVAERIQPHMTLLLDGGSTVIYAARAITVRPLQIVTNSLAIAHHFADDDEVELVLAGGYLYPRAGVTVGPIATGCLTDLHADLCLFSLAAIHEDAAYNINMDMARVEQVMMRQAARSLLLMDASKFGRKSLVRVCGLDEVDEIISDNAIDTTWRERLGDRLTIAPSPRAQ